MDFTPDLPFTTAEGLAAGLSYRQLRGPRFRAVHRGRGVWVARDTVTDLPALLTADQAVLPADAAISHLTGLGMYGVPAGSAARRHWTTGKGLHTTLPSIVLHRREERGAVRRIDGFPVLSPARCLADVAPSVSLSWLVGAGDQLILDKHMTLAEVRSFAQRRIHGAKRLRIASALMREGSKSFRESGTRLIFVCAGIPEPRLNVDLYDDDGEFIACNDFRWDRWKTVAEYDGWYHDRTKEQRNYDLRRIDRVRDAGLNAVQLTSYDYDRPVHLSHLVWAKLATGGYAGPRPAFNWELWEEFTRWPKRRRIAAA